MRRHSILAAAAALLTALYASVAAQTPPPPAPPLAPPQAPPAGGGRGRGGQGFPAQQRKLADAAIVERGGTLYGINCRLCHGPDLRGGDLGGVNLLRSQLVLNDQDGELIYPVVKNGRAPQGAPPMPPLPLPEEDAKAIAAYIHSVAARMAGQGGPPPTAEPVELNIVVGNAAAGEKYFAQNCATCHSVTGDLKDVGSRYASPMLLQNAWVAGGGGRGGRRGAPLDPYAPPPTAVKPVTVAVTTADGQTIEGRLERIDDFLVTLITADGTTRTFRRSGAAPAVQITDPLEGHKKLLVKYTDQDIHDVTAYLVTLK
jgi:cytochrome c oxidase cbb3-type subunit 3